MTVDLRIENSGAISRDAGQRLVRRQTVGDDTFHANMLATAPYELYCRRQH